MHGYVLMPEGEWAGGSDIDNPHSAMLEFIKQPYEQQQPYFTEGRGSPQEQDDWLDLQQGGERGAAIGSCGGLSVLRLHACIGLYLIMLAN